MNKNKLNNNWLDQIEVLQHVEDFSGPRGSTDSGKVTVFCYSSRLYSGADVAYNIVLV